MSLKDVSEKGKIPFFIVLEGGRDAYYAFLVFENQEFVTLRYRYKCLTESGEIACFRLKSDAMLAARHNGWKFIGPVPRKRG